MAVNEECVNKLMACQIKEEFQECLSWLGHETHYKLKTAVQRQSIIPNCLLIGMRLEDVFPERIFHASWLETALCILRPFKMPTSASCHMGMHMGLVLHCAPSAPIQSPWATSLWVIILTWKWHPAQSLHFLLMVWWLNMKLDKPVHDRLF